MKSGTTRALLAIGAALVAACGGDDGGRGVPAADGGSLIEEDAGPIECVPELENGAAGAGCNGGFQGTPAANEPGGRCALGTDTMPAGSCATARAICMGDLAGTGEGWCVIGCSPPETEIAVGSCPSGYRCFRNGEGENAFGLCYRDCDADHPCQDGWSCNEDVGRCEELPPL